MLATSAAIPPWPLAGRVADIAQAWSLLEALNESEELDSLLQRMSVPEPLVFSRLFTAFHPAFHFFSAFSLGVLEAQEARVAHETLGAAPPRPTGGPWGPGGAALGLRGG